MNEKSTERYDEIEWFKTADLSHIASIVKKGSESLECIEKNVDSIHVKGRAGKEVFSRLFMLVDDCYSLMCDWLNIEPGTFVLCLTNVTPMEDIFGAEMIVEEGNEVKKVGEKVVLLNFHVENFRERDERGENPVEFIASIMSRIVYLMLYHDIEMMKKKSLDKSHASMPIVKTILEKMSIESIKDMEKWL